MYIRFDIFRRETRYELMTLCISFIEIQSDVSSILLYAIT